MIRILLIRHGQTEWNRREIFRGHADIPLSDQGMRQAQALADRLSDERIAAVYSSPLIRASATAERVAKAHGIQPLTVPALTDISYGAWEGHQHQQVEKLYPDLYVRWRTKPHLAHPPGGETLAQVRRRVTLALDSIVAGHRQAAIVVVSHRVVNKLILCHALGLGDDAFWRIRQSTCCLNVLEWERDRAVVGLLNDTCHLRGLEEDTSDF